MTETNFEIDATPDPSMLLSMCAANLDWRKALAELIDNAIDAGSTDVSVTFGKMRDGKPESCTVSDNGGGTDRAENFFRIGGREQHSSTRLGRYGVGAKDACLWIGGKNSTMMVSTIHRGHKLSATAHWPTLVSGKSWAISGTSMEAPRGELGTKVAVHPVAHFLPYGEKFDELISDLGYIYTGALDTGRRIIVQGLARKPPVALQPYRLPPLEPGEIETTIEVNGRSVHIRAGVVREGESNHRPGLTYVHAFRVIKPACGDGLGSGSIGRIAGTVTLGPTWPLKKNKDDIAEGDELYAAVSSVLRPLIERAERSRMVVESAALCAALERVANTQLGLNEKPDAKARRGNGEERGSKEPRNTGRKHRRARRDQPGNTFRKYGSIRVEFADIGTRPARIGQFSSGVVILNTAYPRIAAARQDGNADFLSVLITTVLAHAVAYENAGDQIRLAFDPDEVDARNFHEVVATMLAEPMRVDGQDMHAVAAE